MINVLIVEDDPMVAALNKQYMERIEGFALAGIATDTNEALEHINDTAVDLMLLDVYMPGLNGIDFLRQIREQQQDIDVILITAASEISQIQESLRLGAVDYLIKPFEFDRFQNALMQYKNHYDKMSERNKVNQQELDRLFRKQTQKNQKQQPVQELPKGLTRNTLKTINKAILTKGIHAFSTEEIADETSISRVSVRKYLKFLSEIGYLNENLVYGVGRPIYQYNRVESQSYLMDFYL